MAQRLPIRFYELLQLSKLGIGQQSISFAFLTMESEKFICVREKTDQASNIVIIDLASPNTPLRRPINADAAVMNPVRNVLALAAGQQLQVFDMGQKTKVSDQTVVEPIVFWRWLSETTIAFVTGTAVFHWNVFGGQPPKKMFDRMAELSQSQIINYRADKDEKWLALVGIAQEAGQVVGHIQLFSVEKNATQNIEGHAAAFVNYTVQAPDGRVASRPSTLFVFAQKNAAGAKLLILEVTKGDEAVPYARSAGEILFPADAAGDFPMSIQVSEKYEIAYLITKLGYLHMYHLSNGALIYRNRISTDPIFVTAPQATTDGLLCVNRKGQVLAVSVDDQNIVPYIVQTLGDVNLGIRVAAKNNLPGAENLLTQQFESLLSAGQLREAAALAFRSPGTSLRNAQTLARLQKLPATPGQPTPLLLYFGSLLELGKLNQIESLELARIVLQQGRLPILQTWVSEGKFECSEQLGDVVKAADPKLALQVYYLANAHGKVVAMLGETGQQEKILAYCQKTGYVADMRAALSAMIPTNPEGARQFAQTLLQSDQGKSVDLAAIVDEFLRYNLVKEVTALLLEALKDDRADQGPLQTRLLEVNLMQAPQVADAILSNEMFHHYNRQRIAQLCEQAGLFQRALEHYTELSDIRRVVMHTNAINPEFLLSYFGQRSVEDTLEILQDMLRLNLRGNLSLVVQIAQKYNEQLTPMALIGLFEKFKCFEGIFYFLNPIVNTTQDPDVVYKYIEAAAKTGQVQEVERVCRESDKYDPAKVRDFLKEVKLPDQLPLIIVCDRFGFVEDLTRFLYQHNLNKYIEAYVQKINPANTPAVVGALLDCGCNEDYIRVLVLSVRGGCPIDALVAAVEGRNRLKLILPWLEQRSQEGSPDPALHNALAKCFVDLNRNAEEFLTENTFYDSRVVGKYCEDRDPYLAFVAYRRGKCDQELIDVTNSHALFKYQAKYLVERQDLELWATVLSAENKYKRSVVDQVVQTALPESKDADHITTTVKAFMNANMPSELIELLEKIVLEGRHEFSGNKNLQNLLILTAVKADKEKVMDYVTRLDNYDAVEVANICITYNLFEEAFIVFKKFKHNTAAVTVLIDHIKDLGRGKDFADKVNEPEVWSKLAKAQLDAGEVRDSVDSFIRANDHEFYIEVIKAAEEQAAFEELVKYLQMCRKKVKEPIIESELIFGFAKTKRMAELEDFISTPNCAQIQNVGDRCFDEGLYEAAKLLFNNISNFVRLASTLVRLEDFVAAVDAARKANSTKTWREVAVACLDAKQFPLAQTCGLKIVIHGDELADIISQYERRGYYDQAIALLEAGLPLESAHAGMFTELAVLYSKYREEKLMDYLRLNVAKLAPQKVIRICRDNQQWRELTFLYQSTNDFDHAVEVMIEHSVDAWDHVQFRDNLSKGTRPDLLYRSVEFYLLEQPRRVNELLQSLLVRLEHPTVVERARRKGLLSLVKPYLVLVQDTNTSQVNEALNELLIEEGDHEALRKSVDTYQAFDCAALAQQLENHKLLEFRRISATLFTRNKAYDRAIEICKRDGLFGDAMAVAAQSGAQDLAESLLAFFVTKGNKGCFVGCLYVCYDLIRPDVVLELAWRNNLVDIIFPFLIQSFREHSDRIAVLEKKNAAREKKERELAEKEQKATAFDAQSVQPEAAAPYGMLALPAPPGAMPPPGMMPPGMMPPGMMPPGMMPPGMMPPGMMPPQMPPSQTPPRPGGGFLGLTDL
jgi:clathrin heavy chain